MIAARNERAAVDLERKRVGARVAHTHRRGKVLNAGDRIVGQERVGELVVAKAAAQRGARARGNQGHEHERHEGERREEAPHGGRGRGEN